MNVPPGGVVPREPPPGGTPTREGEMTDHRERDAKDVQAWIDAERESTMRDCVPLLGYGVPDVVLERLMSGFHKQAEIAGLLREGATP